MWYILILENIRSSYNVGNMIRTADALGWQVRCSGFTPYPDKDPAVTKTSLGAEKNVWLRTFWSTQEALASAEQEHFSLVALEITEESVPLNMFTAVYNGAGQQGIALVCGNENTGVLPETLLRCSYHVHIPMLGIKESLNVGQASAIAMRELNRGLK